MTTTETETISSLEASLNLEGHSEFLSALLAREDLGLAQRASWTARLEEARVRSQAPELYLAVVGEFSGGKSTLVNALIRELLLPADVLPATTGTAVLVRSGPHRRLGVEYLDGRTEEITDNEAIREQVERLITVEEIARTVARVTIDHPAAVLRERLVVVDLPGSNVENARHVEVAGQTIRDLCDTALVAIPANIPVSESLTEFLRVHLDEVLHRCIFVVTKIDQLSSFDRSRVLATVQGRLATKLRIAAPLVLEASASVFLGEPLPDGTDANTPGAVGDAYRELQVQFLETELRIVCFLRERRTLILLERSAALLMALFEGIQGNLRAVVERYREEREALAAGLLSPLSPFLAECRVRHVQALEARLQTREDDLLKTFAAFRQQTLQALWSSLGAARSRAQVVHAATYGTDDLVTRARTSLWEELLKVSAQIGPEIREEITTFEACFLEKYGAVATPESSTATSDFPRIVPGDWTGWTRPKPLQAAREEGRRKISMAGGAVLGVFMGFLLFFILGFNGLFHDGNSCGLAFAALVLSPFFCAFLGGNLSVPIECLRRAYWSDLGPSIETFFSRLDSTALKLFEEVQRAVRERVDLILDGYLTQYDALVQDSIASGESHIAEVLRVEHRASGDLADLERRLLDLQRARNGLKQIQKL